jgi:hypothetical protein
MSKDIPMHTESDLLTFLQIVGEQEYVIKRTPTELKYGKSAMEEGEDGGAATATQGTSELTTAASVSEATKADACLSTVAECKADGQDKKRKSSRA